MSNIFTWEAQDIDLKDCIKLKTNCQQSDTMVLQFNVFDYDNPVDLTNFNVTFVAKKPDGTIYGQAENITKSNNSLTITCDRQLTAITGRSIGTVIITDNLGNRKGSYFIVLNIFGIVNDDDRVISRNFVDILDRFDEDINIAMKLSKTFKEDIVEANELDLAFQASIENANTLKTNFNTAIANANTNKIALDNSNTNALATKSALDTSRTNAINTKASLDSTITSAITVKSELGIASATSNIDKDALITTIASADTKLQEFKNYDTTQLVPLSNTMLNEMYCNKELLSINHGLNGYPIAKMTYTEFGGGVGGAGDFPAGADSDCNLMQNKAIYTDNNNMTIFVPQNYYIALPSINKINDHKYIVTFTNSTRSLLIELIEGSTSEDIKLINDSIVSINNSISDLNYQTAQGTSNVITLIINKVLTNGYSLTFIASANNNSSATTINGKNLYKPNTILAPNLIQGKAYEIWYNQSSDCFFIRASASGNLLTSQALAGTIFSTDVDTDLVGTMPNRGALSSALNCGGSYTIPLGYHNGLGVITANSLASQTVASATANQILYGITAWINGVKVTGNIPSKSAQTYIPSTVNQTIASGQYISDVQTILGDADLIASNIINTANIFNVQGTANANTLLKFASGTILAGATLNLGFTPLVAYAGALTLNSANNGSSDDAKYAFVIKFPNGETADNTSGTPRATSSNVTADVDYARSFLRISGTGIVNNSAVALTYRVIGY